MITNLVDSMNITVPVAIPDHGDYEVLLNVSKLAILQSCLMVLLPFEENLKLAKDEVEKAHAKGILSNVKLVQSVKKTESSVLAN